MLIPLHDVSAGVVAVIISREIAVTGLRGVAAVEGWAMPADTWGKRKTAFQDVAIIFLLIHYEYFGLDFHGIGEVLLIIAMILGVWSGLGYCRRFYERMMETPAEK